MFEKTQVLVLLPLYVYNDNRDYAKSIGEPYRIDRIKDRLQNLKSNRKAKI